MMKKGRKHIRSLSILKWDEGRREYALSASLLFINEKIDFRDDTTPKIAFETIIFPKFFHNYNDFVTFVVLSKHTDEALIRDDIFLNTGLKRTTQFYALDKLMKKGVVERITDGSRGQGRPKAYFRLTETFIDEFTESFKRFSKEYICPLCNGAKEKITCDDSQQRIVCNNPYCDEDEQFIQKKIDQLCQHGLKWELCDECRAGFLFKEK